MCSACQIPHESTRSQAGRVRLSQAPPNTAFLRPAPQGRYLAVGEVERRGRQLAFTHARLLREDDGQTVATATSTLALVQPDS